MISAYKRGELLELQRNPYFDQWSYAAQPAGYPDAIRYVKSNAGGSWKDVLAGRADLSYFPTDLSQATALLRQYRSQVHSQPWLNTVYLSLNPHIPPFNDVRVRRALSAAIDRRTLAMLYGGPANAIPTCQLLPVGFPGHRTYCPYADADFAPRTAIAQALVQQSRTAGQEVTVWGGSDQDGSERVTRYVAWVLAQLGYRPAVHLTPTSSWLDRLRGADVQVGMVPGLNADYPEAGSFFGTILACASAKITSTNNVKRYCDPRLDERIDSATKAERTDPAQALAQWTAVDKKTVDDAPLAPTVTGVQSMLVSRRLGNFQQTPLAGLLFGQMWVQ